MIPSQGIKIPQAEKPKRTKKTLILALLEVECTLLVASDNELGNINLVLDLFLISALIGLKEIYI